MKKKDSEEEKEEDFKPGSFNMHKIFAKTEDMLKKIADDQGINLDELPFEDVKDVNPGVLSTFPITYCSSIVENFQLK